MKIEIRINGRAYTEATFDDPAGTWREEGEYRPTEAMARAFDNIRDDVLQNTGWVYGAAYYRPVRQPSGMTDETAKLIESHLDALVGLQAIFVREVGRGDRDEQIDGILSDHEAAREAIQNPFLE